MAVDFAEDDLEIETEREVDDIYVRYDIASYPSDHTLSVLFEMWSEGDIEIPDYQRDFVWNIKQSSLLIDSFLCGLPVPPVFFYISDKNKNIVIDGQQRIMSVAYFLSGYFGKESTSGKKHVFRLSGLGERNPHNGLSYAELEDSDKRKLKQSVLRAVNIRQLNPESGGTSAYYIFERLNTGGTPLRPQEIRNCVFRGEFSTELKKANEDINWRLILGKKHYDKHQKDVELILRVFALTGAVDEYEKPMKEFLNNSMDKHKSANTKKSKSFISTFATVTRFIVEGIGVKPFHLRGPINVSALDSVMVVLLENHRKLHKIDISQKYKSLLDDAKFDEHTRINTTDPVTVVARIERVRQILLS